MRYPTCTLCFLLVAFLCIFSGAVSGQVMSSENFSMEKGAFSGGGGDTGSDSFSILGTSGQSSPVGDSESGNFSSNTGFLDDTDLDGDGVLVDQDLCPLENSTGFDANVDGCIDTIAGLITVVSTLPDGVLSDQTKTSLTSKVEAALASSDREKDDTAIKQLNAFINEVNAQRGKKVSVEASEMLILYVQNVITLIGLG